MKKTVLFCFLSVVTLVIFPFSHAFSTVIFYDDFSSGIDNWMVSGDPMPSIVDIDGNDVFSTNGDENYDSFGLSNQMFSIINNDFELSIDMLAGKQTPSQSYATYSLTRTNYFGGTERIPEIDNFLTIYLNSSINTANPNILRVTIFSEGGSPLEDSSIEIANGSGWHNVKTKIRKEDNIVEVYFDNALKFTSANPITDVHDGNAAIALGNRLAYHDNVTVSTGHMPDPVPEPATLLLMGSGLIGLAGARRKLKK